MSPIFRLIRFAHFAVAVTLLVSSCTVARAQSSKVGAAIEGEVADASGGVVRQAVIELRNIDTQQLRTLITDDRGFFRAEQLPVGAYQIRVNHPGFAPFRQNAITLSLGQTVHLNIVLSLPSASQQVTVSAHSSPIDVRQTSVVSSIDQERIEELPVRTRNYLDFALLAPGVSNAPRTSTSTGAASFVPTGFTFGGLRPESNSVSIDGLDNNDEFTGSSRTELSPEIVQEFQVVNNGLSAESGGASGGSINVITRSGTNIVHGDAFIFAQDSATNARDPFETDPAKPSFRRFRTGFALGGPIVKGRTFYYAAIEQEHNRGQIGSDIDPAAANAINSLLSAGDYPNLPTRQITTGFSPTARAETEAAGKLDQQLTAHNSLMLRYAFTNNKETGNAFNSGGLFDASSRGSSFISDNALSGSLTTILGSNAVNDFRFQIATRRALFRTNQSSGPEIDIAGLAIFGHPYFGNSQRRENQYQAVYAYTRTAGPHLWKFGATLNRVSLRAALPDGFDGIYLFGSLADFLAANPDQFRQAFGSSRVDFPVTAAGAFAQDHWSISHQLTLDLGARYDFEALPSQFNQDTNNFSPRIGLAWSPSQKLVFRAGYGVFFDRVVLANLSRAIQKNGLQAFEQVADNPAAATFFQSSSGGTLNAPAPGILPSIFTADSRMATPYSQQTSVGAQYLLAKNLTVRADYLFVHGLKLPRTININLLPPTLLNPANAAALGVPNPTPQQLGRQVFSPARLNPRFDDVSQLQNSASSTYNGVSFTLSRTMNEELEFSASYTVSKTQDDASDYDEQPQNPFQLSDERALSRQNQQQRFVFNALWDLPIGDDEDSAPGAHHKSGWLTTAFSHIELAPIFTAESGRPVDPLTGVDSNRSHAFPLSSRPLGFARNSLHTPATLNLDFRFVKYFPFGEYKHLDLVAESFNLLNHANVIEIDPVFGSAATPLPQFNQPTEGAGPRQVEFSIDFEF